MAQQKPGEHGVEGRNATFHKKAGEPTEGRCRDRHDVLIDEPEWSEFGEDRAPSPVDYLMIAVTSCQVSVLSQSFDKAGIEDYEIDVNSTIDRVGADSVPDEMPAHTANRIQHVDIEIDVTVPDEYAEAAQRSLDVYDQGCIVGQSFRSGIDYTPHTSLETTSS
ncbi:OsmC family protein [Halorubrum sp. DTA98]|uniref:OsmC family protein n=1 Tax=Halorubrum sp. DTA98 TaxID=3402163 RepID=UPI003AAC398F